MDPFLALEWSDYTGGDLEIPLWSASLVDLSRRRFVQYLSSAELWRYERIVNEEVRISYGCAREASDCRRLYGSIGKGGGHASCGGANLMLQELRSSIYLIPPVG
jgi:hypothetical protein